MDKLAVDCATKEQSNTGLSRQMTKLKYFRSNMKQKL